MTLEERRANILKQFTDIAEPYLSIVEGQVQELIFCEERISQVKNKPFIARNGAGITRPTAAAKQYKELSQVRDSIIRNLIKIVEKHSTQERDAFEEWLAEQKY